MTISPVAYTVQAAPLTATYTANLTHKAGETSSTALNIGNLQQQGEIIDVTDGGTTAGVQSYNFTLNAGDSALLSASFSNIVDQATTRVQLLDSQGNIVADNQGTTAQQAAYTQFTSSGLIPGAGNYSVQVTPVTGAGAPQISLTALQQQGTSLSVSSTLNTNEPAEYYNFSVSNSDNIKLAFASNANSSATRVQLYNSTGQVVADNQGTSYQRSQFAQLTSGTGLAATGSSYQVKVSYADGTTPTDAGTKYNFQLYSGTNYAVVYQTNAAVSTTTATALSSVTATTDAQGYGQTAYHTLNETAQTGVSIGYLKQDKTSLNVTSLLTQVDSTDYYNFVLQDGSNNLKLALSNLTDTSNPNGVHLQLLDNTGARVIADNQGTAAQKAAFAELTSATGLTADPGTYVVKATYGQGVNKTSLLQYNFQFFSGTSYSASYKTTATAQTYQNAVLNGNIAGGYSPAAAAASYLNDLSSGTTLDIMSALQTLA
jgi:hypothetical protein